MPWVERDALRHTKKAKSRRLRQMWSAVANRVLAETQDDSKAIREANAAVSDALARAHRGGGARPKKR